MATASSSILCLPAELLHRIFAYLENDGTLAARMTCQTMAEVGKEHILSKIVGIYTRNSFDGLVEASHHPYFSRRIKELHLQADIYGKLDTFQEWKTKANLTRFFERARSSIDTWKETMRGKKLEAEVEAAPTQRELAQAYDAYKAAVKAQEAMSMECYDVQCLSKLFQNCPSLDRATIAIGEGFPTYSPLLKSAFAQCIIMPNNTINRGVRAFYDLAEAVYVGCHPLKHLSLIGVSAEIFNVEGSMRPDAMMPTLESFQLQLSTRLDPVSHPDEHQLQIERNERMAVRQGKLGVWLRNCCGLQILRLRAPFLNYVGSAELSHAIGDTTWAGLQELCLRYFSTTENELADLLLRHKTTLRRLSLSHLVLRQGEWDRLFERLAGSLPVLRHVILRGSFTELRECIYDFDDFDSGHIDARKDHIKDILLNGGELIETWDAETSDLSEAYEKQLKDGHDEQDPDDIPGYCPPCKKGILDACDEDLEEFDDFR